MRTFQSFIVLIVLLLSVVSTNAQTLIPELKCFEKIVNQKWIGRFDDPSETAENQLTIESILNGAAVMETHCVPEAENFCSKTLYYWDPEVKTIAAIRITNNRWLFRSTVTPKDSVFLYEGTRYSPEGDKTTVTSERVIQGDGSIRDNKGKRDSRTYKRKY